jgi:cytochrome c oxidase cbb3-type subunit 2
MSKLKSLLFGLLAVILPGWAALALLPLLQLGNLAAFQDPDSGASLPMPISGQVRDGSVLYAANGCAYCHTQAVRPEHAGPDLDRGWGFRRTVARDYINGQYIMGQQRLGSDLANYGLRAKDANWIHCLLYAPDSVYPGTRMPSYKHLYKLEKVSGVPSPLAVQLPEGYAPAAGWQVVPTQQAESLAAYLLSLKTDYALPEASLTHKKEEKPAGAPKQGGAQP